MRVTLEKGINTGITHRPQKVLWGQGAEEPHKGKGRKRKKTGILCSEKWAVNLKRIHTFEQDYGFRCYSEASDVWVHRQRPKAQYQLNTDTPHHTVVSEITGARCAISDTKCSVADFNSLFFFISFPLVYSLVSFAVPFCQDVQRRKSWMSVSAYWGKWTFEMTEGDFSLSAREDASELSEGPLGRQW